MEVILREDIDKLGNRGEVVKVAPGYARNFLIPKRLAVAATESNKKIVEQERQAHLRKEAKQEGEAQDLAKLLNGVTRHDRAEGRRKRPALRFGHVEGRRRRPGRQELHHRPPQDPVGRADQATRRVQGPRAPAQGT